MKRTVWFWARLAGGAAILAVLVRQLGTGPFLQGLSTVSGWSLLWAALIALASTLGSAWRWSLVSRGLGVEVSLGRATAAYYRSQFLNTVLPGGVLGDVHRAVAHGRDVGDVGRGLRAVAWERSAGQAVQVTIAVVVLLVLPSPIRSYLPAALAILVGCTLCAAFVLRALPHGGASRWARTQRAAAHDIRNGLLAAWPRIALASLVVVAGHTATFLVAVRTAGLTASTTQLLPLVMLVMLAMAVPMNIGGWGPREGVAAWLFAAAGLGAGPGVAAATVYGMLVLVATLPGAVVLVVAALRQRQRDIAPAQASPVRGFDPHDAPTGTPYPLDQLSIERSGGLVADAPAVGGACGG